MRVLLAILIFSSVLLITSSVRNELIEASHNADYGYVKMLLELDPEILSSRPPVIIDRTEEVHGRTAIMVCGSDPKQRSRVVVDKECLRIAKILSARGANMSHVDNEGWNAVSMGASRGYTKFCKYLISKHRVDLNSSDNEGRTALMKSAANGYFETFAMLLNYSADISTKEPNHGMSAVHFATTFSLQNPGQCEFLRNLTSIITGNMSCCIGADFLPRSVDSFRDNDGRTPLMYAAISNNMEVCDVLLKYGADPRLSDNFGVRCTSMASDEAVRMKLIEEGIALTEKEHRDWLQRTEKKTKKSKKRKKVEL